MQEKWEMQVWSLDQEDPLEEGMTTHSSVLAWIIPWTEEHGRLQSIVLHSQTRLKQISVHAQPQNEPLNSFFWRMMFRKKDLDGRHHRFLVSQQPELSTCTGFNPLHTHIYIYVFIYLECVVKTRSSYWYHWFQFSFTGFILAFLSLFITSLHNSEKPTSHYPNIITHFLIRQNKANSFRLLTHAPGREAS